MGKKKSHIRIICIIFCVGVLKKVQLYSFNITTYFGDIETLFSYYIDFVTQLIFALLKLQSCNIRTSFSKLEY